MKMLLCFAILAGVTFTGSWACCWDVPELANAKPATQSSTKDSEHPAWKAVDGKLKSLNQSTCAYTSSERNPWWRVDLQDSKIVSKVVILNSDDCCGDRLNDLQITVGDSLVNNGTSNGICVQGGTIAQGEMKQFNCRRLLSGRYVNIMILGDGKTLTLCEALVYGIDEIREIAHQKPAVQSSTVDPRYPASKAVDGGESTILDHNTCAHTSSEENPWWRVDLQERYEVGKVVIVNRGDCCGDRLDNFQITVGNSLDNHGNNNDVCVEGGKIEQGEKNEFVCDRLLIGRYVNIMIPGDGKILTVCEVLVYGILELRELANRKPTAQSSTFDPRYSASKAVDGEGSVILDHDSCAHTSSEKNPWWRVDLQERHEVSKVVIVNRGDCCGDRLNGFQITVGDSLSNNGNDNEVCIKGGTIHLGERKLFVCTRPLVGQYVNIMVPGEGRILTVCEVLVYGK